MQNRETARQVIVTAVVGTGACMLHMQLASCNVTNVNTASIEDDCERLGFIQSLVLFYYYYFVFSCCTNLTLTGVIYFKQKSLAIDQIITV